MKNYKAHCTDKGIQLFCKSTTKEDAVKTLKYMATAHGTRVKSLWEQKEDKSFKKF